MNISEFMINPGDKVKLKDIKTNQTGKFNSKEDAKTEMDNNIARMIELQDMLYAYDKYALLLIFQGMDASGKDGAIKHVMSGINPQGCQVFSFKKPSDEELDHDYLWRIHKAVPERGRIGIFNRSHYEETLVVRVHNLINNQKLPDELINEDIWEKRFRQISDFEKYLFENGIITLKFFLHISKEEQKKRFLERINDKSKNWKFSEADVKERAYWELYQKYFEEAISATSKKHAPWHIIPADRKWFARWAISSIIVDKLESLNLNYPALSSEQLLNLNKAKDSLLNEKSV